MLDRFNRKINYLRISVTDRCNLRCKYCMPEQGVQSLQHEDILSFEEIESIAKEAVDLGVDKIRLTGGEPLVRKGILNLVQKIAAINGVKDFGLTTNGVLLNQFAKPLFDAGLMRINISLDTLDEIRYRELTRGGNVKNVLDGIFAAKEAGFFPIKINCVIKNNSEEEDAQLVSEFCAKNGLQVRFIHMMNLENGEFSVVEGGDGGNCLNCSRLRLTADGKIKPCLFSDLEYDVKKLGIRNALLMAVNEKPECGTSSNNSKFYNIGG